MISIWSLKSPGTDSPKISGTLICRKFWVCAESPEVSERVVENKIVASFMAVCFCVMFSRMEVG